MIENNFGKNRHLITNLIKKNSGQKIKKKYCVELRQFAVTLNFYSPKAYAYVRDTFNSILPSPRTLSKWYKHVDAEPGFTVEALNTLAIASKNASKPLYCALMMDEISIRKHVEWDGNYYHGYVNFGAELNGDDVDMATECFVIMVVGVNVSWKLPVGYFYCNHLNSDQKSNLIKRCINVVNDTGVNIISLTFDGCYVNISMAKELGCKLIPRPEQLISYFNLNDCKVNIILDPSHMIKLVRNALGEKKKIIDLNGEIVDFDYIEKLLILQENEHAHLGNKLKKEHVFYFRKKMKVKLATQLLSRSVANSLEFCMTILKLKDFENCRATINFINIFNDAFDILNSRYVISNSFKGAVNNQNYDKIFSFIQTFFYYVNNLRLIDGKLILKSQRATGFLGFLVSFSSLMNLKKDLIDTNKIDFLPFYKLSQDHLEMFFGNIRSQGGYNNNPTARQFKSAYKKIMVNSQIKDRGFGNCVALEDISILNCSSVSNNLINIINDTNVTLNRDIELEPEKYNIEDHGFHLPLSSFSKEVTIYIAGFISHKLASKIKCDICVNSLFGVREDFLMSLIDLKNRGGLSYPSNDVIKICILTEKIIKLYYNDIIKLNKLFIQNKTFAHFIDNEVFTSLNSHDNIHTINLIKSIISTHYDIKIKYLCKKQNETVSLRSFYNKLTIFRGQ